MTNKQKMINGEEYLSSDEELIKERAFAKDLCFNFNNTPPSNVSQRNSIINKLFGKVGNNVWIEPSFYCDYGYNISVGDNFYTNHNCVILDCAKVTIGNNVFLGPNVGLYTAGHPLDVEQRINGSEYAKPITIEDNVWIGGNVCVTPGVTIGANSIIGAGSTVTKDIPPNVVAVGNPCKVLKEIK